MLQQTVEGIAFGMYTLPEFFTELLKKFSKEKMRKAGDKNTLSEDKQGP